ncbi:glycosyltransferase [Shewanella gaetbuli]|uniref:Glycosyltransferase n=1 Tax=Shewanella gaetbuli TaxID=220752 RepID=A0A9X2CH94_9GAMM|nr:glycosyltransferase [Shewanella gaetbuli]MCL1143253.1 glycosyltransferase [Shewanella gaetbuli]
MHRIISIHPFDPRGFKVGGIETHVRNTIKFFPKNVDLVVVGVDETNQLPLGVPIILTNDFGRSYTFIPVLNTTVIDINTAAKNVFKSLTFNFFFSLFKYQNVIKEKYKELKSSVEIQRYEFSWFCYVNRFSTLLITHGDADPNKKLDSLLGKVWFLHKLNESFAVKKANRVISVSSEQTKRLKNDFPSKADVIEYMTVSVDDNLFIPTPYKLEDDTLRIAFAGRLDEFKRPQMMFKILKTLKNQLNSKIEFHYIGVSNPKVFKEYADVQDIVVCHGFKRSSEIAEMWKGFHMGIVTSVFEGWPVYVMEAICAGRPVVSLRLEQMQETFEKGVCGEMLSVNDDSNNTVSMVCHSVINIWDKIKKRAMCPSDVNESISGFKSSNQINKLFDLHCLNVER